MRLFALAVLGLLVPSLWSAEPDENWLNRRIAEVRGTDKTAWRKVPWADSLLTARRMSAQEKALLFLFTHDGNIDTGRC